MKMTKESAKKKKKKPLSISAGSPVEEESLAIVLQTPKSLTTKIQPLEFSREIGLKTPGLIFRHQRRSQPALPSLSLSPQKIRKLPRPMTRAVYFLFFYALPVWHDPSQIAKASIATPPDSTSGGIPKSLYIPPCWSQYQRPPIQVLLGGGVCDADNLCVILGPWLSGSMCVKVPPTSPSP